MRCSCRTHLRDIQNGSGGMHTLLMRDSGERLRSILCSNELSPGMMLLSMPGQTQAPAAASAAGEMSVSASAALHSHPAQVQATWNPPRELRHGNLQQQQQWVASVLGCVKLNT